MQKIGQTLILATLLAATSVEAAEITVCVTDKKRQNNQTYFQLPNTKTVLLCEIKDKLYPVTLRDLYRAGWRLIQVVDVRPVKVKEKVVNPSPLIYLEKETEPTDEKKKKKTESEPFNFFGNNISNLTI